MSVEENKKIAARYFEHNPDEVEELLTPDFTGRTNDVTWNRDDHKRFWIAIQNQLHDTIHRQVAEGDWVATWFTRVGTIEGKPWKGDVMGFAKFVDGKIAEVWELFVQAP